MFFISQDGTDMAATQRAYHPDELKSRDDLKIGMLFKKIIFVLNFEDKSLSHKNINRCGYVWVIDLFC